MAKKVKDERPPLFTIRADQELWDALDGCEVQRGSGEVRSDIVKELNYRRATQIRKGRESCCTLSFPTGPDFDFETPEALANAIQHIKAGTPIVVRDEKTRRREVVWAPGDED